jgi:hypothetical protein
VSPDGIFHVGYLTVDECRALSPTVVTAPPLPGSDIERDAFRYFSASVRLAAQHGHGLIVTRA